MDDKDKSNNDVKDDTNVPDIDLEEIRTIENIIEEIDATMDDDTIIYEQLIKKDENIENIRMIVDDKSENAETTDDDESKNTETTIVDDKSEKVETTDDDESKNTETTIVDDKSEKAETTDDDKSEKAETKLDEDKIENIETKMDDDKIENTETKMDDDKIEKAETKMDDDKIENTETKMDEDKIENIETKMDDDKIENTETKMDDDQIENTETKMDDDKIENTETKMDDDKTENIETKMDDDKTEKIEMEKDDNIIQDMLTTTNNILTKNLEMKEVQENSIVQKKERFFLKRPFLIDQARDSHPSVHIRIQGKEWAYWDWPLLKKELLTGIGCKVSVAYFFNSMKISTKKSCQKCHCYSLPSSSYSITMENFFCTSTHDFLSCAFTPNISGLTITPFYFSISDKVTELLSHGKSNLEPVKPEIVKLKNNLDPVFANRSSKRCMILLANTYHKDSLNAVVNYLKKLYKKKKIITFGGILDNILICYDEICMKHLAISGLIFQSESMNAYTLYLHETTDYKEIEKEFQDFKTKVKLNKYSICYMFYCRMRCKKLIDFEQTIFKTKFPNVDLYPFYGMLGYESNDLYDLSSKIKKLDEIEEAMESFYMLITIN